MIRGAALGSRGANLAGLGISQCAPLGGRGRKLQRALSFNPALSQYVSAIAKITPSMSVEIWCRSSTGTWNDYGWIASCRVPGGFIVHPDPGTKNVVMFFLNDTSGFIGPFSISVQNITVFHHYAVACNAVEGKVYTYLDGNPVNIGGSSFGGARTVSSASPASYGWDIGSRYGNGASFGARIYNRVLPPYEIAEHYRGIFSNNDGLVGRWDFDEADGLIANDKSGYGNHGTLVGNPQRVQVFKPDRLV